MLAIYLIFELSLCCMVSDFDNKYGLCPIANLDDDEHVDGKKIKKIEGQYSNMKEFTDKIKNDNIEKENAKIKHAKVLEEEKKLLELEKKEKEKKKEARSKSESEGESLKDLSERIRREAEGELIKNPERLRQIPKKKELTENEKLASYKIETDKLLKEFERLYDNGEITREEYKRLKEEVTKK
ncbi:MAG: hypothetical protein MJ246_06420 [Clostridia bacterium]|nr:hypothetical protein [Clostridia bacterium]